MLERSESQDSGDPNARIDQLSSIGSPTVTSEYLDRTLPSVAEHFEIFQKDAYLPYSLNEIQKDHPSIETFDEFVSEIREKDPIVAKKTILCDLRQEIMQDHIDGDALTAAWLKLFRKKIRALHRNIPQNEITVKNYIECFEFSQADFEECVNSSENGIAVFVCMCVHLSHEYICFFRLSRWFY